MHLWSKKAEFNQYRLFLGKRDRQERTRELWIFARESLSHWPMESRLERRKVIRGRDNEKWKVIGSIPRGLFEVTELLELVNYKDGGEG